MSKSKNLVIYHANCMDGFGAAWAAAQFLSPEDTAYWPCNYGEVPPARVKIGNDWPDTKDTKVFIVDFSFPRDQLEAMCLVYECVVVLDHHKTAQEALTNWEDKPENLLIYFDMDRSGAQMTWDYFSPDNLSAPALISYIQDRDLWRFNLPHSREINAVIAIEEYTFEAYTALASALMNSFEIVVRVGRALLKQHTRIVDQIILDVRKCTIEDSHGNITEGLSCNCTPQFSSDVGNRLTEISKTFGATYFTDSAGNTRWSLRSSNQVDVSKLAKAYGGGGHKNAAGFTLYAGEVDADGVSIWLLEDKVEDKTS